MFCKNCGNQMDEDQKFCDICGAAAKNNKMQNRSETKSSSSTHIGIKCFVPDCTEGVVGQCMGLPDEPCGHFYCSKHSKGKLCDECNAEFELQEIIKQYCNKAEWVKKGRQGVIGFIFFLGILASVIVLLMTHFTLTNFIIGFVLSFAWFIVANVINQQLKYREACRDLDGFDEFYKVYKTASRKEAMSLLVPRILGFVADAIDATAEAGVQSDIRRIRRRIENM